MSVTQQAVKKEVEGDLVTALAGLEITIPYVQFVEAKRAEDFVLAIRSV